MPVSPYGDWGQILISILRVSSDKASGLQERLAKSGKKNPTELVSGVFPHTGGPPSSSKD